MNYDDLFQVFSIGIVSGIILSVIPAMIGEAINLAFKIMKGG